MKNSRRGAEPQRGMFATFLGVLVVAGTAPAADALRSLHPPVPLRDDDGQGVRLLPFAVAVNVHHVRGFLLAANAVLGAFHYITTGTIRQYLPEPRDFVSLAIRQGVYYVRGMFRGQAHPLEKTAARRLNPLQQGTYLIILKVLLPLQKSKSARPPAPRAAAAGRV